MATLVRESHLSYTRTVVGSWSGDAMRTSLLHGLLYSSPSRHSLPAPRRPRELLPAQDVQVQVVHALAPRHPIVDHHPEPLAQPLLRRHRLRSEQQVTWTVGWTTLVLQVLSLD